MALEGSLDLFVLLVSYTTGSILLSLLLWALILLVTGIMGRMSFQSILIILITYFGVASVGYAGSFSAIPIFLWAVWYMVVGVINAINQMR